MGQVFVRASRRAKAYTRSSRLAAKRYGAFSERVHAHTNSLRHLKRSAKRQAQLVALNKKATQLAVEKHNLYGQKKALGRKIFGRKAKNPFRSVGLFRLSR